MKLIKKYELAIEPKQKVDIPFSAEIIKFAIFQGKPTLWAEIDPTQRAMARTFLIVSGEKELPVSCNRTNHIDSFEHEGHMLHVYEE